MPGVNLEAEQQRVAERESKHDAAITKLDALAETAETARVDKAEVYRAQRDVAQAGLAASRAAHRNALLQAHVTKQALLVQLQTVNAELHAMIAKYEPERLPKEEPVVDDARGRLR